MDAGISDEKTIGPVNVLAIKAGLIIPYNIVRVLIDCIKHCSDTIAIKWDANVFPGGKKQTIALACEVIIHYCMPQKGEPAPFFLSLHSGGKEL